MKPLSARFVDLAFYALASFWITFGAAMGFKFSLRVIWILGQLEKWGGKSMMEQLSLFEPANITGVHREVATMACSAPEAASIKTSRQPAPRLSATRALALAEFAGECIKNSGGKMHAGNLATSKRLKDTLYFLRDGAWHSTLEIRCFTNSCAVHSDIAGLVANGIKVESKQTKGRIWRYRIITP